MKRIGFLLVLALGGCGAGGLGQSCGTLPASLVETTINGYEDLMAMGMTYQEAIATFTGGCQQIDGAQGSLECLECYNAIVNQVYGR